jgi:Arc/MetJ family transcription regulator
MLKLMHRGVALRTTLAIDDELLGTARKLTGVTENAALVRAGLKALIEREAARRLAALGGTAPDFPAPPRRKMGKSDSR